MVWLTARLHVCDCWSGCVMVVGVVACAVVCLCDGHSVCACGCLCAFGCVSLFVSCVFVWCVILFGWCVLCAAVRVGVRVFVCVRLGVCLVV